MGGGEYYCITYVLTSRGALKRRKIHYKTLQIFFKMAHEFLCGLGILDVVQLYPCANYFVLMLTVQELKYNILQLLGSFKFKFL